MQLDQIKRRKFITLLGGAAAWPLAARAQQPAMPVIGFLTPTSPDAQADRLRAFRQGLKETGHNEGENVTIAYRWADNQIDRVPELVADLVHRKAAVIATVGDQTALAAKAATTTIPIVFVTGEDPVRLGLVTSLARPGGNMTGVNIFVNEVVAKRLELLRELVPGVARVAVLINPANFSSNESTLRDMAAAARVMGLQVQVFNADTGGQIDAAFATLVRERPDAIFVSGSPLFTQPACPVDSPGDASCGPRHICRPSISRNRWAYELWSQPDGCVASGWCLYRSNPQGREASGPAGHAGEQARACDQCSGGQGARSRRAAAVDRPRRRGDRMKWSRRRRRCGPGSRVL